MSLLRRALRPRSRAGPTDGELAALGLILGDEDPRLRKVRDQLIRAPTIKREKPTSSSFRVGPTSTFDDLSFPLEVDRLESEWMRVRDTQSGRDLEFRVVIGRHGFLQGLEGRATDGGPWPSSWSVDPTGHGTSEPLIRLPSAEATAEFERHARERLAKWLGITLPTRLELTPPVSEPAIAARQLELGGRFPGEYLVFLSIVDGVSASGVQVLGCRDAYPIDSPHLAPLVVAWDADDQEDYVVVLSMAGSDEAVYRIDVSDPEAEPHALAARLSDFLRSVMAP